jgi:putative addiction module component (TIGR02574 family)
MSAETLSEILKLSVDERIQLVEDIWDSIAADPRDLVIPDEQTEELDRRLDEAAANPGQGRPWSEVRDRLLGGR